MNTKFFAIFALLFITIFCNRVVAQNSDFQTEKYFAVANKYFDKNDYQNAIIYYDSAIYVNAEYIEAYAYRGICRFELKQYENSITDFDFTLTLAPGYAEVYYYRGLAKFKLGYKEKACEDWFEAYSIGFKTALSLIEENCEQQLKEIPKK